MDRTDTRVVIAGLILVAIATGIVGIIVARPNEARSRAATESATAGVRRLERDQSGQCIPSEPAVETGCDPLRQAMWENRTGEFTDFLRSLRAPIDSSADIFTAHLRFRAEAGDLAVLRDLARQASAPDVRVVAVGLSPSEPAAEYVEVRNVGAAPARLEGVRLQSPDGAATFRFAPVFRFPGTLAAGEFCRVYTQRAGQPDACSGEWDPLPRADIWPESGASIVLRTTSMVSPSELDRWWYRP